MKLVLAFLIILALAYRAIHRQKRLPMSNALMTFWLGVVRDVRCGALELECALDVLEKVGCPDTQELIRASIYDAHRKYLREKLDLTRGRELRAEESGSIYATSTTSRN